VLGLSNGVSNTLLQTLLTNEYASVVFNYGSQVKLTGNQLSPVVYHQTDESFSDTAYLGQSIFQSV